MDYYPKASFDLRVKLENPHFQWTWRESNSRPRRESARFYDHRLTSHGSTESSFRTSERVSPIHDLPVTTPLLNPGSPV